MKLLYYCFDWDDNILHMDTKILMEQNIDNVWSPIDVSTTDFASFRKLDNYRLPLDEKGNPDYDKAYINFRDTGENGEKAFLQDCVEAIDNMEVGPSYFAFKKCLIEGSLFAIITARGHEPDSLRKGVKYFIDTQLNPIELKLMIQNLNKFVNIFDCENSRKSEDLIDNYLNCCEFLGVSSQFFIDSIEDGDIPDGCDFTPNDTEISKQIAIEKFAKRCVEYGKSLGDELTCIKIGFSDDDIHNVESIAHIFENRLKEKFEHVDFVLYDTSKNEDGSKNYIKTNY